MPRGDGTGPRWGGGVGAKGRRCGAGRRNNGAGSGRGRRRRGIEGRPPVAALRRPTIREIACVDEEKCIGCGVCAAVCLEDAIDIGEKAHVNQELCRGCGDCLDECPTSAMYLTQRSEKRGEPK